MPLHNNIRTLAGGLMAALVLGAAACSSDSSGPESSSAMSQPEAQDVAADMESQVATVTGSLSLQDFMRPPFPSPLQAGYFGPMRFHPMVSCGTVTPNPPVDSDGDNVPDIVTVTFTLPDCHFGGPQGATFDLTGAVTVTDPSATAVGLRIDFQDLEDKLTLPNGMFFLRTLTGVRQLLADQSGFSAVDSLTSSFESSHRGTASLANAWLVDFTVDQGGSFAPHQPLPSGSFTIDGTTDRTWKHGTKSFTVTTPVPLHFNASCTEEPKLDSGVLHVVFDGPHGAADITLTFTACGVRPTMTLVTTPSTS